MSNANSLLLSMIGNVGLARPIIFGALLEQQRAFARAAEEDPFVTTWRNETAVECCVIEDPIPFTLECVSIATENQFVITRNDTTVECCVIEAPPVKMKARVTFSGFPQLDNPIPLDGKCMISTENPPEHDRIGPDDELHKAVHDVIGGMGKVIPPARKALRDALDRADAPDTGRAKSDKAIGRAIRFG